MRLPTLLLTAAAAALIAAGAVAQDQPTEPPAKAEPGLSDLSDTVEGLQDEPAPASAETQPTPEETASQPSEPATPSEEPAARPTEELVAPPADEPAAEPPAEAPPPAPAPAPSGPPQPLTRAQLGQLAEAAQRGRLLGVIANAGQIATRDMLSRVSDPAAAGVAGWIAEPAGNGATVTFYAEPEGDAPPGAVFRASILGGRVTSREIFLAGDRPPLNRVQARMAAARRVAAAQEHRPCGADQFNYFVVPPSAPDGPIEVYQISPQTARGRYPVGGHFKTVVAADGTVTSTRGYTNACLDLDVPEAVAGAQPRPLAITHLMDPLPTEVHAFLSIWTGRPLVVVADDPQRLFAVTGEGIAEVPRTAAGR